jgi:hypothetical protein
LVHARLCNHESVDAMPSFSFQHLSRAVGEAARLVHQAWIAAAHAARLGERPQAVYLAGLLHDQSLQHPFVGDPLQAQVINDAANAQQVEEGTPAYHLPSVIDWPHTPGAHGPTARGVYYLFVPFRHFAPRYASHGAIPAAIKRQMLREAVYRRAKRLQPGQSLTAGPSQGTQVHAPGLTPYVPAFARNIRPGYTHAAREEGLRRYPGRGLGRGGGAAYLTFRTMTSVSPGWWIPAQPGQHIAAQVQQETEDDVRAVIEAGARQDVEQTIRDTFSGGAGVS